MPTIGKGWKNLLNIPNRNASAGCVDAVKMRTNAIVAPARFIIRLLCEAVPEYQARHLSAVITRLFKWSK